MDAYSKRFASKLSDLLMTKKRELTDLLVSTASPDHSSYMERVGHIRGLDWAIREAAELETQMSAPETVEKTREKNKRYED